MLESVVIVIEGALGGAVVGGVTNYAQGDDVLKSVRGGVAGGIAAVLITLLIAL